jgi:hypothetical protein
MTEKQYLLQFHLSRRMDEGWNQLRLVTATSFEEAVVKLKEKVTYTYRDDFSSQIVIPDNIICLNID